MIGAILILLFAIASFNYEAEDKLSIPTDQVQHIEGKRLYVLNCIRCHNADPSKSGTIGPELYTTPERVFRTKVLEGVYPKWYSPKRHTKIMQTFPHLTTDIDKIYNYIRSTRR